MRKLLCCVLFCAVAAFPAFAQMGGQGAPATDPLATGVKNAFKSVSGYLAASSTKMPEENYGMRAGTDTKVRTFGQIIGHVANANYLYCARAKGEKNPNTEDLEKTTAKADLVKALQASLDYCSDVYNSLTDASATAMVTINGRNGQQIQTPRLTILWQNVAHNNEEYGNLVGYFRMKDIVPPSSDRSGM
jgi:uncharacterized damage-inducible protein DinB